MGFKYLFSPGMIIKNYEGTNKLFYYGESGTVLGEEPLIGLVFFPEQINHCLNTLEKIEKLKKE